MKMVIAIIDRGKVEKIAGSLSALGVSGMTMSEVKCPIESNGPSSSMQVPDYRPKVKIEIALRDGKVDALIGILSELDMDGDLIVDKACVLDIEDSIRIRTGEKGESSL